MNLLIHKTYDLIMSKKFKEAVKQEKFKNSQAEAALNIIYTANWLDDVIRCRLKSHGISPKQYNVLRILKGRHPKAYALQQIQCRMLTRWSNASRLVEKLKKKGYLTRQPMETNRRKVEIKITEKGLALIAELEQCTAAANLFEDALPSHKARQLSDLLDE